jgi:uroporphyrinogen-III synthase
VAALGFEPLVEPLLGIEELSPVLPDFDTLAFTSANGVRSFARLSARRDAVAWCVGGRTAEAAREAGFAQVEDAGGDVGALAAAMIPRLPAGSVVLHAANAAPAGDLCGPLRAAGVEARFVAVYRAVEALEAGPTLAAHLAGGGVLDAALIHSPAAGRVLARLATGGMPLPDIAAISLNAAASLGESAGRVEIAEKPDEASLLAALVRLLDSSRSG